MAGTICHKPNRSPNRRSDNDRRSSEAPLKRFVRFVLNIRSDRVVSLTAAAVPVAVPAPAQSASQSGRVTTMPSAAPEPAKVPAARR